MSVSLEYLTRCSTETGYRVEPLEKVVLQLSAVETAAAELGCSLASPFSTLSFLALPVIPQLRLTDLGLVDVDRFELLQ